MSQTGSNPLPSRRALRQQGLTTGAIETLTETGSIAIPQPESATSATPTHTPAPATQGGPITPSSGLPQPQSRRQRREQEQLIATGAIPVVTAQTPPPPSPAPAPDPAPSAGVAVAPQTTTGAVPAPAAPTPAVSPPVPPVDADGTRLLSRRERREMEQRGEPVPETGRIPVVTQEGLVAENAPAERAVQSGDAPAPRAAAASYGATTPTPDVGYRDETPATDAGATTPTTTATTSTPLPPVFSSPAGPADTHTAPARAVGAGSEATNALILPVAPSMDLAGPIGDTGEVLVTGNISLPRSVSEKAITGVVDLDEDAGDFRAVDTGSFTAPIRATEAVSSRTITLDQPMIRKPRWGAASVTLGFSAAILGLTAVGLLALALLTDIVELPF